MGPNWYLAFFLLVSFVNCSLGQYGQYVPQAQPHVHVENGMIRGAVRSSAKGRPFYAFMGIRYAKPPVGKHRFKDPVPPKPWRGVWDASVYGSECLQWDFVTEKPRLHGDEDCLFVNVFTPRAPGGGAYGPMMDVIVFIHGGAFMYGASNQNGPEILMDRDVVVVTFNYRLGPLGFLSTEDDYVPGNMGLKDQSLALRWVQQNIAAFGGNPSSVTITGCSAGGASVHYHYLSPLSRGYFQRGMSLSGSALLSWTQQEAAREKAQRISAELGCPTFSSREMIECLRRRPARRIVQLVDKFQKWYSNPISPFAPVVERGGLHPFLTEHPIDALRFGRVQNVPWIASVTTAEGNYPVSAFIANPKAILELDAKWHQLAPHLLDYNYTALPSQHAQIADRVKQYYLRDEKSFGEHRSHGLIQMVGDRILVVDQVRAAKIQASISTAPVYFYRFSYRGRHSLSEDLSKKDIDFGVAHGDDLSYTINTTYMKSGETEQDKEMREVMLDLWTHFASTGNPNFRDTVWDRVIPNQEPFRYLSIINSKDIRMGSEANLGKSDLWDSLGIAEPQIGAQPYRRPDEL